jgi:hypothetical protein
VGQLAHREAMFGDHWSCICDINRTISRLNIFKLKLLKKRTRPEVFIHRGESGHRAVLVLVNRIDAEQAE